MKRHNNVGELNVKKLFLHWNYKMSMYVFLDYKDSIPNDLDLKFQVKFCFNPCFRKNVSFTMQKMEFCLQTCNFQWKALLNI